jgi:hypothetical protein
VCRVVRAQAVGDRLGLLLVELTDEVRRRTDADRGRVAPARAS